MSEPSPAHPRAVFFTEVGPRDGLQNLALEVATQAKVELVERLLDCGVDQVEAASFVSPKWVPKMADAEAVLAALVASRGPAVLHRIRVLVPNQRGLERALACGVRHVVANLAVTDTFNRRNLNHSVGETLAELEQMAAAAAANGCLFDVGLSVAFGCPFEGRVDHDRVAELADRCQEIGVAEIGLADTIGVADPRQVGEMLEHLLRSGIPTEQISLHLHDTRGMGLANALAAYEIGVRRFEGSVGGIGGCPFAPRATGNVCSEDLLYMLQRVGATLACDVSALCRAAEQLEQIIGERLPGRLYLAGLWPNPKEAPVADPRGHGLA
ncbi:MAG: hydroxymethylglutaryl-CoA lyase [Candidatus Dormibacteraeota bacterium]|nr:hydroxymethylglutaryl-CoA lyase [Candidatus Dormibacteraeota bacterium]